MRRESSARSGASLPGALVVLLLLSLSGRAAAEQDDGFQAHCDQARELFQNQRYEEALGELRAAQAVRPDPRLLLNLGHACRHLSRLEEALGFYRQYQERMPALTPADRATVAEYIVLTQALIDKARTPAPPPKVLVTPRMLPEPPPARQELVLVPSARAREARPGRQVSAPVYKQWWFWGLLGVVTAGTVATAVLASQPFDTGIPANITLHDARF